jgi:hypothetical protein
MTKALEEALLRTITEPTSDIITEFARSICNRHSNVVAVLAYGSALRDSNPQNTLVDFYVIAEGTSDISKSRISQLLCKYLAPNVYYAEFQHSQNTYRAKYAALTLATLQSKVSPSVANPYFWVRFAQPMRLILARDDITKARILTIMAQAAETANAHAMALCPDNTTQAQWTALFENTYPTELRPEAASRAAEIVQANLAYYENVTKHAAKVVASAKPWSTRRWQGKLLSIGRLAKAAFTFQGGVDYAAWKIKRHSGVEIPIQEWHRRHPIIASFVLLPKILKSRALK